MAKRIEFDKMQNNEIRHAFGKAHKLKDVRTYRHIQVLELRRKKATNKEISVATGYKDSYITELVSLYVNHGMTAVTGNKYTSNNRRMSFEEETQFLEQFREEAEAGLIISVKGILEKYEEVTEKKTNTATIYKLLKRHGWRKVKPRPRHPDSANEEQKDSSKKLTQFGSKFCWRNMSQITMQDTKKS